jgi:hypothetical protein
MPATACVDSRTAPRAPMPGLWIGLEPTVSHPERSNCFAKRSSYEVEGPLHPERTDGVPLESPPLAPGNWRKDRGPSAPMLLR